MSDSQILVVGPAWVGDMVMAQSLLIALRRQNPEPAIDVLAPEWSLGLLERMPEVRNGIALPVGHGELGLARRWAVARQLRATHYSQAIVLPRSMKAAIVPWLAGIPQRTGYLGEFRYGLINDRRPLLKQLDQTVKRFVALGNAQTDNFPQPQLRVDKANQTRLSHHLGLDLTTPTVAILPGAEYGPAKQWPVDSFAELLRRLREREQQAWLLGSAKEQPLAAAIIDAAGGYGINLCGQTRLPDAIDLIAGADYAVSNDSGLMHIAAAVNCPVVALYGSSSPHYTPPLTANAKILYLNLDCSPCFQRHCPYGHYRCLRELSVDAVLQAADGLVTG